MSPDTRMITWTKVSWKGIIPLHYVLSFRSSNWVLSPLHWIWLWKIHVETPGSYHYHVFFGLNKGSRASISRWGLLTNRRVAYFWNYTCLYFWSLWCKWQHRSASTVLKAFSSMERYSLSAEGKNSNHQVDDCRTVIKDITRIKCTLYQLFPG